MRIVFGISGASGAPYARRALEFLSGSGRANGIATDVVFTKTGRLVWQHEVGTDPAEYGLPIWAPGDLTAPFASGSARYDGMLIAPCSVGCASRIANGVSNDLVSRAADVMLKERRPLVAVVRETPLSLIHLRNLTQLVEAGAFVMPASPSFYSHPKSVDEILDTVVCRALDRLGIDNDLMRRWSGMELNRD
ncbi:MAG: UbiX family flavin prenyltransferase [Myxococcales bacterium]|nr:UbiX family flavin prenyltransferase [Myxococcales bacterium]